jgi:tetratricopeptide (TPR) repeat protein
VSTAPDRTFHRWQEEVARDPGSAAFVPLADLYRVQGRLDVARRVCMRGLERNADNVEGHYVLGRIYRDGDEPLKAYDEWDIALTLDPRHLPSLRALAFLCMERGLGPEAERFLLRAIEEDPEDQRLTRALAGLRAEAGKGLAFSSSYWERAASVLDAFLGRLLRESRARYLMLIDRSGRIVAQSGNAADLDLAGIASLTAGIHAAASALATMTGQRGYSQLHHGSSNEQLFVGSLATPPGELLLICLFGRESPIGLVRSLFKEHSKELDKVEWPGPENVPSDESLEEALAAGLARAADRTAQGSR